MLVDIAGKSLIQRVYEQVSKATKLDKVVVATDHQRILDHVEGFGGSAVMTREMHQSGTDRCQEAASLVEGQYDFVVNIQGDEPFILPGQIDELASLLTPGTELATLAMATDDHDSLFSPSEAKVILNKRGEAIYFSRQVIPFQRKNDEEIWINNFEYLLHIGIYGYHTDILNEVSKLQPSSLERAESLEQLRWIEHGYRIKVGKTESHPSMPIDTEEDVERALKFITDHPEWK
jgi:3-deoxy-manno-octulosonate cytidylyltransferase (CMP-KDO synthetase)